MEPPSRPAGSLDPAQERLAQALAALAEVQIELDRERVRREESEALFDLVLESMSDALFLVDRRGRVWRVNDAAVRMAGRAAADLVGLTAAEILGPDIPATPWAILEQSDRRGGLEVALQAAERPVRVSVSCAVIQDQDGKIEGAVYSARDLSETQRLAGELAEAEARWRLLADVGDVLGSEVEPHPVLPRVCGRVAEATGCSAAIVLVDDWVVRDVVVGVGADDVGAALRALEGRRLPPRSAAATVLASGNTVHARVLRPDFPLLGPSLGPDDVRSAAVVALSAREATFGVLLVLSSEPDAVAEATVALAEQVAARVALALANSALRESLARVEAAREADRLREELIASLSHDMQTPLAALVGSISTLRSHDLPAEARERLHDAMWRQVVNLRRLIRQFLDYSRLEVGRPLVVNARPVSVRDAIDEIARDFHQLAPIELAVDADLPDVLADPDRLNQMLANLVSNAVKFSPHGSPVTIAARAAGDSVEISVADRGPGIEPTDQANLFEKFFRGRAAASTQGTGIGLYISRALARAQGGDLTFTSRRGRGSRFVVVLPQADEQA